jgi:hypothetical protein
MKTLLGIILRGELLGNKKLESKVRYLGIEVNGTLEIPELIEI